MRLLFCVCLLALLSGCGFVEAQQIKKRNDLARLAYGEALAEFKANPNCEGLQLADAITNASIPTNDPVTLPFLAPQELEWRLESGHEFLQIGRAAADVGCNKKAHDVYVATIERFSGSAFTSIRQSAQVGLDDLRNPIK